MDHIYEEALTARTAAESEVRRGQPACPYCRSTDTEFFSLFGQQLLTVQYYCNACHTPFEYVKDEDVLEEYVTRKDNQL